MEAAKKAAKVLILLNWTTGSDILCGSIKGANSAAS